jgi:hypothetical protein
MHVSNQTFTSEIVRVLWFVTCTIVVNQLHYFVDISLFLVEVGFQNHQRAVVNLMVFVHLQFLKLVEAATGF